MMSDLWWNRLVNSVRFLDDIRNAAARGQSVLIGFDSDVPWRDVMLDTLEQKLYDMTDSRTVDIVDVSAVDTTGKDACGLFLTERYCDRKEAEKYWPTTHGSRECFLAKWSATTTLGKRFVCLTGITPAALEKWTASVEEYLGSCADPYEQGIFILMADGAVAPSDGKILRLNYSDYVSDYDCMMLCLTLISDAKCSRAEKMYLCEVASSIADGNVELAGLLASRKNELLKSPLTVTYEVCKENDIHLSNLSERISKAIWEAQIKLVFPRLENFRSRIIKAYEPKLKSCLPIRSSNNDRIDRAADLEIGQLYYVCTLKPILPREEMDMLSKMRNARNTLAHWETLTYKQLTTLGVI